jgi:membrane dipeptidase
MALHDESIVVDLHVDTLIQMRAVGYKFGVRHDAPILERLGFFHSDRPRLAESGMTGLFFGLVTFPYPERGCAAACFRLIRMLRRACRDHDMIFARTAEDIRRAKREGTVAALMGIEGGHNLEGRIENVRRFAEAGVSYLGLVHFTRNRLCTPTIGIGSNPRARLTDFGREVVREMNRVGMIVDLAHVARRAFIDAARLSTRPVIVSHTGIQGAYPMSRNIDDDQIRAVAETDGVIGIIFGWLALGRPKGGLEMLAPHFEHVRKLVGARHLAIGSDFDGAASPVKGLENVSKLPEFTRFLEGLGWSEDEIRGVLGENLLRVLNKAV